MSIEPRLRRAGFVLAVILAGVTLVSCASQRRPAAKPPEAAGEATGTPAGEKAKPAQPTEGQPVAQVVFYLRETQASAFPIKWVIRKIALDQADGSQIAINPADLVLATGDLELGAGGTLIQKLVAITNVAVGDYTGVTLFTRSASFDDTGEALMVESSFVTADFPFSLAAGVAKTLTAVVTLAPPGAARAGFKFQPQVTIEGEPATLRGKLVLVTNGASSNLSVIDKSLKRVVRTEYLGTRPEATCVDQRRNRLYLADRKAGVIYEMDMLNQHLLKATQLDFTDEPIHLEFVPSKDLLVVVNYGEASIHLVDSFTFQITETVDVGNHPVDAAYSSFADRLFVVNNLDNTLSVVNLNTNPASVDSTLQLELRPAAITIDDSMGRLYITNSGGNDLTVVRMDPKLGTLAVEHTIPIGLGAGAIILDPYGRRLFVAMGNTNEILCVDPYTGVTIYSVRLPERPGRLMFDPDEKKLYATVPARNAVVVIDTITREIQNWIETGEHPTSIEMRQ